MRPVVNISNAVRWIRRALSGFRRKLALSGVRYSKVLLFYFHLRSGNRLYDDVESLEFSDIENARVEAMVSARELIAENIR